MKKISIIVTLLITIFHLKAQSYGTHLNSSKILKADEYDISSFSQFFSDDRRGLFFASMVDLPFNSETNWRFYAGTGSFNYAFGTQLKWVPIRQIRKNYFSLGATFGISYGRDDGTELLLTRTTAFISREFDWEMGLFEPYFALPFGSAFVDSKSKFHSQATIGAHFKFDDLKYMRFSIEGGFNIKNSQSYLALMATIQLTRQ